MGGHESKQSVSIMTNVVGSAVQNVTQSCISYVNSDNVIAVDGNGNFVGGVTQTMSISVDSNCSADITQDAQFQNKLQNNISQLLKDQEIALTQWMDSSKDESNAAINQSISTNVTSNTVQTCLNIINSHNILNVSGNNNVVKDIIQSNTVSLISQCLLSQGQTSSAVNDITNTVNQHSEYTSKNPLAFITDAIEAMMKSAMVVIAVIFIVLICFVALFMILRHGKKKAPPASSSPVIIQTGSSTSAARGFGPPAGYSY
jgi:hypothetical protein